MVDEFSKCFLRGERVFEVNVNVNLLLWIFKKVFFLILKDIDEVRMYVFFG